MSFTFTTPNPTNNAPSSLTLYHFLAACLILPSLFSATPFPHLALTLIIHGSLCIILTFSLVIIRLPFALTLLAIFDLLLLAAGAYTLAIIPHTTPAAIPILFSLGAFINFIFHLKQLKASL